jgi:N-acyl-D-aspartate/D-glutamate deacylase
LALYVGHNGIRKEVMGNARRPPTGEELARMRALVREGMKLGAVGLSTGLMYEPGMFSDTDEVAALAEEVASFGGIYDSHVRDPVNAFLDSHAEVIEIGRRAGIPVKLGHLKGVALHNEGLIGQVIAMVDKARLEGRVVVSDQYPYDGAATALLNDVVVVPREQVVTDPSAARIEPARLKELLRNPAQRLRLKEASENGIDGGFAWLKVTGYDAMRVVFAPDNPQLVGRYLIHIAEERSVEPFDAIADLIIENDRSIRVTLGAVTEEDVRTLLVQPWNMICSDGLYVGKEGSDNTHPRSTGSFSRILGHYTRELGLLSLPEAVRKMTSLPADFLRLYDRGRIATGKVADIVVFDAARIAARSTWAEPNLYPIGIDHVIVNGVAVLRDGELTGKRPGRFIERQSR